MAVLRLLIRRLFFALPILFGILLLTFLLVRLSGNDPAGVLAGPTATGEDVIRITKQLQLDKPVWQQFIAYVNTLAHGDLGRSWLSDKPVVRELLIRLPATLEMVIGGGILGALIAIPLGLRAALRVNGILDHSSRILSLIGFGAPTIFLGLLLIYVFFYLFGWAPPPMGRLDLLTTAPPTITGSYLIDALLTGNWEAARSAAARLVLPCVCVATVYAAPLIAQTRAVAMDVLASDYARYARACGLPPRDIRRMVWRNTAVPVITYGATELVALFGAAAVLELIFSWGGVSQFGLMAILKGDFAVVQGFTLLMSLIAMAIFAVADIVVMSLDPRARK